MADYDVVVIGAGPGGYVGAIRAAQLGLKTAIVEKEFLGGICLNVGCIPSKSLLKNAEVAHTLRERADEFGFSFDNLKLDYAKAVDRSRKVSKRLVQGVGFLMKKNNIDVYTGRGKLESATKVVVTLADGKTEELNAKNIILATGSYAAAIPGVKVDGEKILTFWEAILQAWVSASRSEPRGPRRFLARPRNPKPATAYRSRRPFPRACSARGRERCSLPCEKAADPWPGNTRRGSKLVSVTCFR